MYAVLSRINTSYYIRLQGKTLTHNTNKGISCSCTALALFYNDVDVTVGKRMECEQLHLRLSLPGSFPRSADLHMCWESRRCLFPLCAKLSQISLKLSLLVSPTQGHHQFSPNNDENKSNQIAPSICVIP